MRNLTYACTLLLLAASTATGAVPIEVGRVDIGGGKDPGGIDADGNFTYIVRRPSADAELYVLDSGTEAWGFPDVAGSPQVVGSMEIRAGANDVTAVNDTLFIAARDRTEELLIVDVSDRTSPVRAAGLDLPSRKEALSIHADREGVVLLGTKRDSREAELHRIDASNPLAPVLDSSYETDAHVTGIAVIGDRAYVLVEEDVEILVFDLSTPGSLPLVESFDLPGRGHSEGIAVANGLLYVVVDGRINTDDFFVLDPGGSGLTIIGQTHVSVRSVDVAVHKHLAYVAIGLGGAGLGVVDVSDPTNPMLRSTQQTASAGIAVVTSGPYVRLATESNNEELEVYDPALPMRIQDRNGDGEIFLAALGDSNTFFVWTPSWGAQLDQRGRVAHPEFRAITWARPGATAVDTGKPELATAFGQLDVALPREPDAVVLAFGTNDLGVATVPEIIDAYVQLDDLIQAAGSRTFIAKAPPCFNHYTAKIEALNAALDATFPADVVIDFHTTMRQADYGHGCHMNLRAQTLRANAVYERLLFEP